MRKYFYLMHDLLCLCIALAVALYLRHGFPLVQDPGKPEDLYALMLMTLLTALFVLPLMRINTSMWRYTSSSDLADIMIAVALVVLLTNSGLFLISRLEMMPRSVPPMHWALAVVMMGSSRMLARQIFGGSGQGKYQQAPKQHVLVVGAGHTAELYLQFIRRIVQHDILVEGFIDSDPARTNRLFQKHKILGTPANIPHILEQFLVHGIHIQQVVLAQMLDELPRDEQILLLEMEGRGTIDLVHFGKHMGPQVQPGPAKNAADYYQNVISLAADDYEKIHGLYPYLKRTIDIIGGLALTLLLLPLMALIALLVALDVGLPVIFWQQRPGLHGKPFRLYKFRTMRPARRRRDEDRLSHKSGDVNRTTTLGHLLRHLRLDELPQLFHIILGSMSFVGPRPLLPDDQPKGGEIRLSVRPGVTGWAQIHGGDALTPAQKLVLDLWYIRHLSLWLDIRILLRTLLVVLKADKTSRKAMETIAASTTQGPSAHEQL